MADDDNSIGGLLCVFLALIAIVILLFLVTTAFGLLSSAGAIWGLGVSSKNFFVAAKKNIGKGKGL